MLMQTEIEFNNPEKEKKERALVKKCAQCGKSWIEVDRFKYQDDGWFVTLKCGHSEFEKIDKISVRDNTVIRAKHKAAGDSEFHELYKFQLDSVKFLQKASGRALIAHEMGLGKTLIPIGYFILDPDKLPCVWICKSSLMYQTQYEIVKWMGMDYFPQIISRSNDPIFPGHKFYIISYDILKNKALRDQLKDIAKSVVIDETQMIKTTDAARTSAVRDLVKLKDHIIGLSGTPIKNHGGEYYSILNILDPRRFYNSAAFERDWVSLIYADGKYRRGGINDIKRFREHTKDFILRYTREEVMPDLPKVRRTFSFHEMGAKVNKEYYRVQQEFLDELGDRDLDSIPMTMRGNLLAYMAKMRHLTGLAKIEPCIDYLVNFLEQTERKIVLFYHHQDVFKIISDRLQELNVPYQSLTANQTAEERYNAVQRFKDNPELRILLGSTLVAGEGINLQFANDAIILERQWNPANEEQAEARFTRIGSLAESVNIHYFVATGTIDEFLNKLIEFKRSELQRTLDGKKNANWTESSIMVELMRIIQKAGRSNTWSAS
jgi:SWI/SNF-related matrix-associated actin-dependent regulator 1 of chromatin subfamily A